MKKIFATLVVVCFVIISSSKVYALDPTNLETGYNYNRNFVSEVQEVSEVEFDDIVDFLEIHAKEHFRLTGEKITWAILSLNNHKHLQFCIFYDKGTEAYKELINHIDDSIDFVQVGSIQDDEFFDSTELAFQQDSTRAALDAIIPIDVAFETYQTRKGEKLFPHWQLNKDKEKIYEEIKTHNVPIYWEMKKSDLGIYTLEVAIGKYVIEQGNTLSEIAMKYHVTIGRLLYKNSNITNPNLIYSGDYLVIK